jgi:hypothetical protein
MSPAVSSLRGAILFGLENGKQSILADLATLKELFDAHDALVAALKLCRASPFLGPDHGDMVRDVIDAALKLAETPRA